MSIFSQRSQALELMDFPIENKAEIFQNFKELIFINTYLGGPSHSFAAIKKILGNSTTAHIADVGSGAGDFLNYLIQRKAQLPENISFTGIDLMPESHDFAMKTFPKLSKNASLILEDYRTWLHQTQKPDIIHASLFCHHLTNDQLVEFFMVSAQNVKKAVVVNDLQRHPLAYYSIKWLTQWFSKSRFTKNDAPLSVLRGFKKSELEALLAKAGVSNYEIKWKWAFRFIIIIPAREV